MYKDENTEDWTNEKEVDYATYRKQYCLLEDAYLIMEDAIDRILEYVVDLGAGRPGRQIISDIEGTCTNALLAANNDPIHRKQSPVAEEQQLKDCLREFVRVNSGFHHAQEMIDVLAWGESLLNK